LCLGGDASAIFILIGVTIIASFFNDTFKLRLHVADNQ